MLKTSFILAAALCALSVPADAAPSPASICAPVKAQQQTFSQFCEGFKPLNAGTFGVEAFGTTDASKVSADAHISPSSPFLPTDLTCDCQEQSDIYWNKGSIMKLGDNTTVVFMNRLCDDSHNNALYRYDHIVATYDADGRLTDSYIIGRSGRAWSVEVKGTADAEGGITMNVTRRDLAIPAMIEEYADLTFTVTASRYTIDSDGYISRTSLGVPRSETVKADAIPATKEEFDKLLAMFTPLSDGKITVSSFKNDEQPGKEIDWKYVRAFINPAPDCDCAPMRTLWTAGSVIETADRYILLMTKSCDVPRDGYPFNEYIVATFTKDGRAIDVCPVARKGDFWDAEITGSSSPFSLTVRQAVTSMDEEQPGTGNTDNVHTQTCTIEADGCITLRTSGRTFAAPSDSEGWTEQK